MRAHNHPAYEAAVKGYAAKVGSPEAARTLENERRLGILIGVCLVLGIDAFSEPVRADVATERAKIWSHWMIKE